MKRVITVAAASSRAETEEVAKALAGLLREKHSLVTEYARAEALPDALEKDAAAVVIDGLKGGIKDAAEFSSAIVAVSNLDPEDVKNCLKYHAELEEMNYPAGLFSVAVNRTKDTMLSEEDIRDIFKPANVTGIIAPGENGSNLWKKLETLAAQAANRAPVYGPKIAEGKVEKPHQQHSVPAVTENIPAADSGLRKRIYEKLFEKIDIKNVEKDALAHPEKREAFFVKVRKAVGEILDVEAKDKPRQERERIAIEVYNEAVGYGAIEDLLNDHEVSEVMVNGCDEIYFEKKGKLVRSAKNFTGNEAVMRAIERIVMPLGRRVDESMPYVDARLPDGSRVNAIIPPLAIDGPTITIRKFSSRKLTVEDLIAYGSITQKMALYLKDAVIMRKNILISGGTGSGKTTLLNVMSSFIPEDERIITIEDSAELRLTQEHVVRLEARPANIEGRGEVTIRDLVKNCLRMRPDRIVVGECRGGEALDMLQAMNTGHEGSMTTVHANTPRDALSRIEIMVLMAGVELPLRALREQIRSAIDVIVQQSRLKDGTRRVTHISEVTGMESDKILMHDVFENI